MTSSAPIHVLHVTYDMRIGGTEQVIRNLIEASDSTTTQMSIYCIEEPLGPWGEELKARGIAIYSSARRPGFDVKLLRDIRRCIKQHAVDVVHCHQYTPWVYGALAAVGTGSKAVFTEHGRFYPDTASSKRRYVNPLLARLTTHITAISEATRQALVDYEYLPEQRIDVIYNGIRPITPDPEAAAALRNRLQIPLDAPVLGSIARFDPIKNHKMMLEAFRRVVDAYSDARLLLVGDGEERAAIEAQVLALELGGNVILPGYIPKPAVWLEAMDVFLLSSFSEGTSMTLLEAMSLGKPCVVTDVGGNPEIVNHQATGFVTPNDEAEAFADAITQLLGDRTLCQQIAASAAVSFLNAFTSEAMSARYQSYYSKLSNT